MPTNRIDATFTSEQREKARAALASLAESLPFLINLGADERTTMLKFGEKNRSFVVKALAIAEAQPEMLPHSFHLDEFRTDVALVESLYPLRHAIETLSRQVDDTYFAAGSEAYAAALLVYQYAKMHNVASGALEETLDDLGQRFARKGHARAPTA
ncbi:hypothetical protein [Candidatus Accumulibacter sp. ACC003]|uniref:hypothetical protein n=1 Tax=Candidatus Accumulibacter sp. ACC003 TaxID=2823334 RepID=UPI0025C36CF5|nr:hypothetical protein [Candidatus Accumulibacter sp. ACC003]